MNSSDKPKPIQIRLPQEVEESLRHVAFRTKNTLNGVVIDCLKDHLPTYGVRDLAGVSPYLSVGKQSEAQLRESAYGLLSSYQKALQQQLDCIAQLTASLNAQAMNARAMQDGLVLRGSTPRVPDGADGRPPAELLTEAGWHPESLYYLNASWVLKNDAASRKCRKEAARFQYEAAGEWELLKEVLLKLQRATADQEDAG